MSKPASERFWPKVRKTDGCWFWTAAALPKGYGRFYIGNGKHIYAHRWAYIDLHGPIRPGLEIDHLCRTPSCVRPDHLEAVTPSVNVQRGLVPIMNVVRAGGLMHCKRGHPRTPKNLRPRWVRGKCWWVCIPCRRARYARGAA